MILNKKLFKYRYATLFSMICLGIESTAHTFGIGIVESKKMLANAKDSYTTEKGGIIPVAAAEHHKKVKEEVLNNALKSAGISIENIDIIGFSQGPGLGPCLRVGAGFAAELSLKHKKPIIGINHCIAHLEIGSMVSKVKDPVLLYVSGANTQVIAYEAGKYRIFGETLDIGVGNFLDSFARELGLGFPGGPKIYELALKGRKFVKLPYAVKGMDVSFSGIFTNLKDKIKKIHEKNAEKKIDYTVEDLCYSAQETVFAMLLEVAERAVFHCNKKELLLGGGVACNARFKEMAKIMAKEASIKLFIPENQLLVDDGAMIAWLALKMHKANPKLYAPIKSSKEAAEIEIRPYERTDDVKVNWRK